ncbi:hypothetical protein [Sporosarcina limicola]|uniref:Uncharacterized protein n=1 Tax=Sporosarcina limicola TaxID=34101 RepID=A0A927MHR9_9BACL|nr:hypothetical protein [Sporosarcina limicola]MBE1553257.1 hypothetical protein [Sporosarcina limicola]
MKRWRGLVRKEWALLKWGVIPQLLLNSTIVFLIINHTFYGPLGNFDVDIKSMIVFCFLLHMISAVSWFWDSLNKEMKRLDIWLHSPTSMWQLVGAKVVFITIIIGCSFLLCGAIVGVSYYMGGGTVSIVDGLALLFSVGAVILLNAIYVMALVFFFWSIYQVFRSRMDWFFSVIIMFVLFIIWAYAWGMIWFTGVFQTVKEMGPMNGVLTMMEPNYIIPGGAILTIGSLVLHGVMTAIYFAVGSMLFEKKVRL